MRARVRVGVGVGDDQRLGFFGNANQLAGGISEALITTAAGLTVAIPSFFFYRYFKGRVAAYVVSMEEQAINLIEAIDRGNVAQLRSGIPGG